MKTFFNFYFSTDCSQPFTVTVVTDAAQQQVIANVVDRGVKQL
jgi:hypothetical protein